MKKIKAILLLGVLLSACSPAVPAVPTPIPVVSTPAALPSPAVTVTPLPSAVPAATVSPSPTPEFPPAGYGPANFPPGIDPLTGLAAPIENLERRPLIVKVENLPRNHRPQFGLNSADHVYEYYTEEGSTRFAAVFYGQNAEKVAPIRSARYFDIRLVQMYRANFVFGGAYEKLWNRLVSSDFGRRLIVEGAGSCPALCRYDPNGANFLTANTGEMAAYLSGRNMDNTRQNLDGLFFQSQVPTDGLPASQIFIRYSGAIYNRWDYDPAAGNYQRYEDAADDITRTNPQYDLLTDRLTGQPVTAQNVVVLVVPYFSADPGADTEVLDAKLEGSGPAFFFRDGQTYTGQWRRDKVDGLLTLTLSEGVPFPLKPGRTWFEVVGASSQFALQDGRSTFTHAFP